MKHRRGASYVGLIATIAIIAIMAVLFTVGPNIFKQPKASRPDGKGTTIVGASMYKAKDNACVSNLNQIRLSITANADPTDESKPQSLEELKLGTSIIKCPVGGEAYVYDPQTGTVTCPHPGHDKY
jgi:hypothetical protein